VPLLCLSRLRPPARYGLSGLADVSANSYIAPFAADPSLLAARVQALRGKDLRFLFGSQDVCNCNTAGYNNSAEYCYPATGLTAGCAPNADGGTSGGHGCCDTYPDSSTDNALDVRCAAMVQGSNRLQRGLNYMSYIDRFYAAGAVVVGVPLNATAPAGQGALAGGAGGAGGTGGAGGAVRAAAAAAASTSVFKHATYEGGHNNSAFGASPYFVQWAFVE
jgi:hypothetical protein